MTGESSGRQGHREKIVVVSPSRSIGMSHYAQGLAASLSHHADVVLLDRAVAATGILAMAFDLRRAVREDRAAVIATSPHWSLPFVLLWVRARGGHVMHGPLIYMASRVTRPFYVAYYRALTKRLRVVILHAERFVDSVRALKLRPDPDRRGPAWLRPGRPRAIRRIRPERTIHLHRATAPYKGVDVFVRALGILMQRGERRDRRDRRGGRDRRDRAGRSRPVWRSCPGGSATRRSQRWWTDARRWCFRTATPRNPGCSHTRSSQGDP